MFFQSQAFRTEKIQILSGYFLFPKKPNEMKKGRISKSGFKEPITQTWLTWQAGLSQMQLQKSLKQYQKTPKSVVVQGHL